MFSKYLTDNIAHITGFVIKDVDCHVAEQPVLRIQPFTLSPMDTHSSMSTVNDCLIDISSWMESSKLKLNIDKTDIFIIGTKQLLSN